MNNGDGHTVHHYFIVKNIDDVAKAEIAINTQQNRSFKYETPQYVNKKWVVWYHVSQTELTRALIKQKETKTEEK